MDAYATVFAGAESRGEPVAFLRSHYGSNRPYREYDDLENEAVKGLCAVCRDAERVKSVCNADHVRKGA